MCRTIILSRWAQSIANPYACHIQRRGRLHDRYHKRLSNASLHRLLRYIDANMVETARAHENFIKYESRV